MRGTRPIKEITKGSQGEHYNDVRYTAERRPVLEEAVNVSFELFLNGDSSKISNMFYIKI